MSNASGTAGPSSSVDMDDFARTYGPHLRRALALRSKRAGLELDDVIQEIFARLLSHYRHLSEPGELVRVGVTIGVNLCGEALRRRGRRSECSLSELAAEIPSAVDVARAVVARDEAATVLRRLAQLPVRMRGVLAAQATEWKPGEVADRMGVTPTTVYSLSQRGRELLRAAQAILAVLGIKRARLTSAVGAVPISVTLAAFAVLGLRLPVVIPFPPLSPNFVGVPESRKTINPLSVPAGVENVSFREMRGARPAVSGFKNPQNGGDDSPLPGTRTCVANTCVGDEHTLGDELYLKEPLPVLGKVSHTQSFVHTCPVVPDNPVLGCREHGNPHYVVDPFP